MVFSPKKTKMMVDLRSFLCSVGQIGDSFNHTISW